MYKRTSHFLQGRASSGRTLSGYPEGRDLRKGGRSIEGEFEIGTAYLKEISQVVRAFLHAGLTHYQILDEFVRRQIATPSGTPWTAELIAELMDTIAADDNRRSRSQKLRQKRTRKR
jgi:hypothetical protein